MSPSRIRRIDGSRQTALECRDKTASEGYSVTTSTSHDPAHGSCKTDIRKVPIARGKRSQQVWKRVLLSDLETFKSRDLAQSTQIAKLKDDKVKLITKLNHMHEVLYEQTVVIDKLATSLCSTSLDLVNTLKTTIRPSVEFLKQSREDHDDELTEVESDNLPPLQGLSGSLREMIAKALQSTPGLSQRMAARMAPRLLDVFTPLFTQLRTESKRLLDDNEHLTDVAHELAALENFYLGQIACLKKQICETGGDVESIKNELNKQPGNAQADDDSNDKQLRKIEYAMSDGYQESFYVCAEDVREVIITKQQFDEWQIYQKQLAEKKQAKEDFESFRPLIQALNDDQISEVLSDKEQGPPTPVIPFTPAVGRSKRMASSQEEYLASGGSFTDHEGRIVRPDPIYADGVIPDTTAAVKSAGINDLRYDMIYEKEHTPTRPQQYQILRSHGWDDIHPELQDEAKNIRPHTVSTSATITSGPYVSGGMFLPFNERVNHTTGENSRSQSCSRSQDHSSNNFREQSYPADYIHQQPLSEEYTYKNRSGNHGCTFALEHVYPVYGDMSSHMTHTDTEIHSMHLSTQFNRQVNTDTSFYTNVDSRICPAISVHTNIQNNLTIPSLPSLPNSRSNSRNSRRSTTPNSGSIFAPQRHALCSAFTHPRSQGFALKLEADDGTELEYFPGDDSGDENANGSNKYCSSRHHRTHSRVQLQDRDQTFIYGRSLNLKFRQPNFDISRFAAGLDGTTEHDHDGGEGFNTRDCFYVGTLPAMAA